MRKRVMIEKSERNEELERESKSENYERTKLNIV